MSANSDTWMRWVDLGTLQRWVGIGDARALAELARRLGMPGSTVEVLDEAGAAADYERGFEDGAESREGEIRALEAEINNLENGGRE